VTDKYRTNPERDTVEFLTELAASKGCTLRTPKAHELFIDIDSEHQWNKHLDALRAFKRAETVDKVTIRPSASGEPWHFHIVVCLARDVESLTERLMFQAMLGSDPTREVLSLCRVYDEVDSSLVSVFFEPNAHPERELSRDGETFVSGLGEVVTEVRVTADQAPPFFEYDCVYVGTVETRVGLTRVRTTAGQDFPFAGDPVIGDHLYVRDHLLHDCNTAVHAHRDGCCLRPDRTPKREDNHER
jgi:hypothetical protein